MIRRRYDTLLRRLLRAFPVVTVLGPRQSGKTTFIRQALPRWTHLDLDRPSEATPLAADPEARLAQLRDRIVFDEAQRVPALFPVLRGVIDRYRARKGRFVLLGSASPSLVTAISESLAGRTAILDLTPFRWDEVAGRRAAGDLGTLWFRGGFPEAFLQRDDRRRLDWAEAYTRTFIERDLALLGIGVSASQMRRLWTLLAHANGGLWNASQVAASLGISYHTVNRYVDILEQTFLVRKLPPYFANIGKRLVKSPKVYFRDTGLLHFFLGIHSPSALDVHPSRGTSWEAFIIDHLVSAYTRETTGARPHFWRTAQGDEVDLLVEWGEKRIPFEVKLHSAPSVDDARGLVRCMRDLKLPRGYIVYPGRASYSVAPGIVTLPAGEILADSRRVAAL